MFRLTSTKGSWVDVGYGNPDFEGQESQHRHAGDGESLRPRFSFEKHLTCTPLKASERESTGIPTPPPSEEKKHAAIPSKKSKVSYSQYNYKLKVKDSTGRTGPRILFRFYNAESQGHNSPGQFRAGLYKKKDCKIPPPFTGPKLKSAFLSHLTPEKKLSPLISTFESFLPALNRALKSDEDAFIAIIDLQKVERRARSRFPNAVEVIWPIKKIIKKYDFRLRNNYKGFEWLIHGIIEESAIIQTIKISELRNFSLTGQIPRMSAFLTYISRQKHAYALLKKMCIKLPKTNYSTGQLVGSVLDHVQIPTEYKVLVARKINNMIKFQEWDNRSRQHAFLKGVYNFDNSDSDSESDGMDVFVVSTEDEEEYVSDATYHDSEDSSNARGGRAQHTTDKDIDSDAISSRADEEEEEEEQALIDAQIHATEKEWIKETPEAAHKMLRMSHVQVPKLTAAQRNGYRRVKTTPARVMIDLTDDADDECDADDERHPDDERDVDEDVIEVQPWTNEEDAANVERAACANNTMTLPLRSTSMRSTAGPGGGPARLEADARMEVEEIMQFD